MNIQPPLKKTSSLIAYVVMLALAIVAVLYFAFTGAITGKELSAPLLALSGTFTGAFLAFRLNELKEENKKISEQKQILNRTLLVLIRQINALKSLSKVIDDFKDEFSRAFLLPAFKPPTYSDLICNIQDLDFLLEHGHPGLLLRLTIEQEGFHQTMETLRIRNEYYVNVVQPIIADLDLNGRTTTAEEFEEQVGERLYKTAINYSRDFYKSLLDMLASLQAIQVELLSVAKAIYPNDRFLHFAHNA